MDISEWLGSFRNIIDLLLLLLNTIYTVIMYRSTLFIDVFENLVDKYPNRKQFIFIETGQTVTLIQMDQIANQVARWAFEINLTQNSTCAVMLYNNPHYMSIWLGLNKVGVRSALINTNLIGNTLLHSVDVAVINNDIKVLIIDTEIIPVVEQELKDMESKGIKIVELNFSLLNNPFSSSTIGGTAQPSKRILLHHELQLHPSHRLPRQYRQKVKASDPMIYIYTSGTTGLPKASKINHFKYLITSNLYRCLARLNPATDRLYIALPLYHSAGGMLGLSAAIVVGCTVILRKKFSVSQFSEDCVKYKVTAFQYIGELCRYLVQAPSNDLDSLVRLKAIYGNGMRSDYWMKFVKRYNVQRVIEFYGATEGVVALFNNMQRPGSLGYVPPILDPLHKTYLARHDPLDPSIPWRDPVTGFGTLCKPNEVGLLLGNLGNSYVEYQGYSDAKATNSKLLTNVFTKGDRFFNSGDLMYRDKDGFFYWSDRTGDTFRWKGENVSTTQLEQVIIDNVSQVAEVTVYGVDIPNSDGRAGMAALRLTHAPLDTTTFLTNVRKHLPSYSLPVFIRVKQQLETTVTFKYIKSGLVKEGYNPSSMLEGEELYVLMLKENCYKPLTTQLYQQIVDGVVKL